jgi:hypothetical protein
MTLANQLVGMKLSTLCIGHDSVHVIFVSEISFFMLNLMHFLSHCQLPYIATYCVNSFSFQNFIFFVLVLISLKYV